MDPRKKIRKKRLEQEQRERERERIVYILAQEHRRRARL